MEGIVPVIVARLLVFLGRFIGAVIGAILYDAGITLVILLGIGLGITLLYGLVLLVAYIWS